MVRRTASRYGTFTSMRKRTAAAIRSRTRHRPRVDAPHCLQHAPVAVAAPLLDHFERAAAERQRALLARQSGIGEAGAQRSIAPAFERDVRQRREDEAVARFLRVRDSVPFVHASTSCEAAVRR